jgi:hypothetical protein
MINSYKQNMELLITSLSMMDFIETQFNNLIR